jgi:hypothetical protein
MDTNARIVVYPPPRPKLPFLVVSFHADGRVDVVDSSSNAVSAWTLADTRALGHRGAEEIAYESKRAPDDTARS